MTDGRVTLREAAIRLGVFEGVIRKRVARGTLRSEMGTDGRRYVYLDGGTDGGADTSSPRGSELVDELRDQVGYLRDVIATRDEEIRRRDVIISQLTQANAALAARVPELEAAESPSEGAERPAEAGAGVGHPAGDTAPQNASEPRSWWRRMFGG